MRLDLSLELATDPHAAARLLADPGFVTEAVRASGAVDAQVDTTGSPDGAFTVTTRRALPSDQIPAHLRGFVGNRIDVRQVDAWEAPSPDGTRLGTVVVDIAGAPVRLTGRTRLASTGNGATTLAYDGDLRAAIPLFASAVENAAAGAIRAALEVVADVARARLQDDRSGEVRGRLTDGGAHPAQPDGDGTVTAP